MSRWPGNWRPIESPSEAAAFEEVLRRLVAPGHVLFETPLRAVGRTWDDILVLFAFEDGSGRFASVVLPWKSEPMESPLPLSTIYETREAWADAVEWALALQKLQPDPSVVPKFKKGDRVMLLKHGDWEMDARGTIVRDGKARIIGDGSTQVEYMIDFDEPQPELFPVDEAIIPNSWAGTTVLEKYLRLLSAETTPGRTRRFRST